MTKRRAWLTPNTPVPEEIRGRCFSVPNDNALVGAVSGALLPLTDAANWEQSGSMTPDEAANIMSLAFEAFVSGACGSVCVPGGTRVIRRQASTGRFQVVNDAGEWVEPDGDMATDPPEARPEATEQEQKCGAASNALEVLRLVYLDMVTAFDVSADNAYGIAQLALSVATYLGAGLGAQVTAFLALTDFAFDVFYAAIELITADYWTEEWTDVLVCILQDNIEMVDGVATFNYTKVCADLVGFILPVVDEFTGVRWQVWYLLQFIGADGLNLAGATQSVSGDCVTCGEWCYESEDFSTWALIEGVRLANGDIEYQRVGARDRIDINLTVDASDCVIKGFGVARNWSVAATNLYTYLYVDTVQWQYLAAGGAGNAVYALTPGLESQEATGEAVVLRCYMDSGASHQRAVKWRVWGTGVNPFAIGSNC